MQGKSFIPLSETFETGTSHSEFVRMAERGGLWIGGFGPVLHDAGDIARSGDAGPGRKQTALAVLREVVRVQIAERERGDRDVRRRESGGRGDHPAGKGGVQLHSSAPL